MSKSTSFSAHEAAERALRHLDKFGSDGECVFVPLRSLRELSGWAEAVSDDEDLTDAHKVLALRFIGDFGTCSEGHNVVAEFRDPEHEPMNCQDATEQVLIKDLIIRGYLQIVWTGQIEDRILWGIVLGHEVWKPDEGEAA